MKKTFLTLAIALLAGSMAFAQKGSLWLGGGLGFGMTKDKTETSASTTDDDKTMSFTITPHAEYLLTDDISLIAGLSYNYQKQTIFSNISGVDDHIIKTHSFGFGVGARKYWSINERLSFYAGLQFDMSFEGGQDEDGSTSVKHDKTTDMAIYLYPGISYKLGERVVLYTQMGVLGYQNSVTTDADDSKHKNKSNTFGLLVGSDPALEFGVMFKLF